MKKKSIKEERENLFDFVVWFFEWRRRLLRELSIEAFRLYTIITNDVNEEGNLKPINDDLLSSMLFEFPEYNSYRDVFSHVDLMREERINNEINDLELLLKLAICCHFVVEKIPEFKPTRKEDVIAFVMADWNITEIINLLMGTLSERNMKTNPGGEAMKRQGQNKQKVIREIMREMQIETTAFSRSERERRDKFYYTVKEKTGLTEDRISRLARSIIKKEKTKKLEGKPALPVKAENI